MVWGIWQWTVQAKTCVERSIAGQRGMHTAALKKLGNKSECNLHVPSLDANPMLLSSEEMKG